MEVINIERNKLIKEIMSVCDLFTLAQILDLNIGEQIRKKLEEINEKTLIEIALDSGVLEVD